MFLPVSPTADERRTQPPPGRVSGVYLNPPWAHLSPLSVSVVKYNSVRQRSIAKKALNPEVSMLGHTITTFLFVAAMILYTISVLWFHFMRPPVEEYKQLPAVELPSMPLTLAIRCTNPPFCGNVSVTVNYTGAPHCADAASRLGALVRVHELGDLANATAPVTVDVELCVVPDTPFSPTMRGIPQIPGVLVDFTALNPGVLRNGTLEIPAPQLKAHGVVRVISRQPAKMHNVGHLDRSFNVDTWQVKTLVVGQRASRTERVVDSVTPVAMALQYEGGRVNWRATLIVALAPFANVLDISRPGSLPTVVGSIGGAWVFVSAGFVALTPLWRRLFPMARREVVAHPMMSSNPLNGQPPM